MPTITITIDSSLPPERVLEAAVDFSQRRTKVFPAVEHEHFEMHSVETHTADVTEGTGTGIGISWERCRYDWSQSGPVVATVTDSNVYAPGSSWHLTASPAPSGARVEMTWVRRFKHSPRGLLFGTAFRLIGRPMFRKYANQIIDNLETPETQVRPVEIVI
jgi:hypothetical protein